MIVAKVRQVRSKKLSPNASQKKQSLVASVVIIVYFVITFPIDFVILSLVMGCPSINVLMFATSLHEFSQLTLLAVIPIILCLRTPEARRTLLSKLCCTCSCRKPAVKRTEHLWSTSNLAK